MENLYVTMQMRLGGRMFDFFSFELVSRNALNPWSYRFNGSNEKKYITYLCSAHAIIKEI